MVKVQILGILLEGEQNKFQKLSQGMGIRYDVLTEQDVDSEKVSGHVKWFDQTKGFGFVVIEEGGPDVLLHANVLRNFGQSSVADNAAIVLTIQETDRGVQALEIHQIDPPKANPLSDSKGMEDEGQIDDSHIAFEPARVKWFDKTKGFGFANVFGKDDDIFVHVEVLQRSGFADLQPGEAICLKVIESKRGSMASSVSSWDAASKK